MSFYPEEGLSLVPIAPALNYDDSIRKDGSIQVLYENVIRVADPCFQFGEFSVPSERFFDIYRPYLGVWVAQVKNTNKLVYLGFGWLSVNSGDSNSIPYRWVEIKDDSSNNTDYPFLRFKVSESWIHEQSDGGVVESPNVDNSFIRTANLNSGSFFEWNKNGFYFEDKYYTAPDKWETETDKNTLETSVDGFTITDKFGNIITLGKDGILLKDKSGNFIQILNNISDSTQCKIIANDIYGNKISTQKDSINLESNAGNNTLVMNGEGVKVNGKYIVTEEFLDWFNQNSSNIGLGATPGSPVPLHPGAKVGFNVGYNSVDKFKTSK